MENAIQGLSRDLSGTSAPSKLAAANCCCNISLGDSRACFSLCKFTAPYLIAELESPSQPLVVSFFFFLSKYNDTLGEYNSYNFFFFRKFALGPLVTYPLEVAKHFLFYTLKAVSNH